nr:hypothetical protein [Vibrio cholerae]
MSGQHTFMYFDAIPAYCRQRKFEHKLPEIVF